MGWADGWGAGEKQSCINLYISHFYRHQFGSITVD